MFPDDGGFLSKLLPSEGLYCVAQLLSAGGFKHFFYPSLADAQAQLGILDQSGSTCYIAQATYDPAKITTAQAHNKALPYGHDKALRMKERSQANALLIKNFFLDIDCGEKWPLKNQQEGAAALKQFIADSGLPFPAVINSGNGLYAQWLLDEAIDAEKWRSVAFILKQVVAKLAPKLGGDSSRTSDSASVLRAPGTTNRKPNRPNKPVVILRDMEPIRFLDFAEALNKAARKAQVAHHTLAAPKPSTDINSEFYDGLEPSGPPSDAYQVADLCAQLREMKESGGNIAEPHWYACLGLLAYCENGDEVAQAWSAGHPDYDFGKTSAKMDQWRAAGVGPTTCVKFGADNPEMCIGCKANGKIKSPIVLGRPVPEEKKDTSAPSNFKRAEDGLYWSEDGHWVKFYDMDLFLERLAYDHSLGYEVMTIRHYLPFEGDLECTVRSSLVNDPKMLMTTLADNHIKVVGNKEKKIMVAYLESYQAKLQRERKMQELLCQMGWKTARNGSPMFVLGRKVYNADGSVDEASLARNVPAAAEAYHSEGSLYKWSDATKLLGAPGMEQFAFALLTGLGAPLMRFTGYSGAIVSLHGESGTGKSLITTMIQSIYGAHKKLMMLRGDTSLGTLNRLGVYGNLPLTVDEVTNSEGISISDFAYQVTQGRVKVASTKNGTERTGINEWNTIAITTSNSSLIDKLSGVKADASAEINRVFEYQVHRVDSFQEDVTTALYWTVTENYGHAGEEYVKWLVKNEKKIKPGIDNIRAKVEAMAQLKGEERFWGAVVSAAIFGGLVAKSLGLIQFEVMPVLNWVCGKIFEMREDKVDLTSTAVDILGQFLDDHANNRLLVKGSLVNPRGVCTVIEAPRGPLVVRYEIEDRLLYLSRTALQAWLGKKHASYSRTKNDLLSMKALVNPNKRKVLGAGTTWGGALTPVWEIDMSCAALGRTAEEFRMVAEEMAREKGEFEV